MSRPKLSTSLRIAWSVAWGIVCLPLIVMWVRSYKVVDFSDLIVSAHGNVFFSPKLYLEPVGSKEGTAKSYWLYGISILTVSNVKIARLPGTGPAIPYVLFVLVAASLVAIPWLRFRYSLRTLLIATTLVAVALGLIMWTTK
jgi:hypothetical protein